jgi:1,4-alpha-glucan branching enzyme
MNIRIQDLAFERAGLVFVFNFHYSRSYRLPYHVPAGRYRMILDSDEPESGAMAA